MKLKFTIVFGVLCALLCSAVTAAVTVDDPAYYEKFKDQNITLNVYNWGEYISNGEDESMDVIDEFEKLTGIDVIYTNFTTNEDLYAKLSMSKSMYDIIIPSDYMIARMINEDMLEPLDYDNIPNIKYIDPVYHKTDFDPEGTYSVPYTWGTVGIIYNTKYVTKPVDSWNILWDEDYAGKILMIKNSRDAFGIALKKLGYSMNTTKEEELRAAADALKEQKQVLQAYAMDQTFDKMELEEAYVATYYAGDALTMMDNNPNLAFCHPKEGANVFIDSICIPKGSKNKQAAEAFINFLCETDVAVANCEYICYSTPHLGALQELDEEITSNPVAYPDAAYLEKCESFIALPAETNSLIDSLWIEVTSGIGDNAPINSYLFPVAIILVLAIIILVIVTVIRKNKKKRNDY